MKERIREIGLPLALAFAIVASYFVWFLPATMVEHGYGSLNASFDFHTYFRPRFWLGSQEIWQGRWPLWNPYEWGGIPLLATGQPAALYPPKILIYGLLEPIAATWVFLIIHYFFSAAGYFWFLRTEGMTGVGLFVGTVFWTLATPFMASNYHPVRIACLSILPYVFVLSGKLVATPRMTTFAVLAAFVAAQITAGYPEFTIDLGLLVAIHVTAGFWLKRYTMPPWKSVPLVGAAFALGALAAAAQLFPLGELAGEARRIALASRTGTLPPMTPGVDVPIPMAAGLVLFGMIGIGLRRSRQALPNYLACLLIANGMWQALRYLPGFSMVRFPLAWVLLSVYFFAWFGAAGAEALSQGRLGPRARRAALAVTVVFGLGAIVLFIASHAASEGVLAADARTALQWFYARNVGSLGTVVIAVFGAAALVALGVAGLAGKRTPVVGWYAAAFSMALAHVAAYPHGAAEAPFRPPAEHGAVHALMGDPAILKGRTLAPRDLLYGYEITEQAPSALGVEISFLPWRFRKVLERLDFLPTFGTIDWVKVAEAHGFWNAMDVEVVATHPILTRLLVDNGFYPARRSGEDALFTNPGRLGRGWVNYAVRRVSTPDAALDHVLSSRFDPSREVVLEENTRRAYPAVTVEPVTRPSRELRASPVETEFDVLLPRPGVFVMSESAYPGWHAEVDGVEKPWLTANYVSRAVELDAGLHRVRFFYRPASFAWGLAGSTLGLLGIAGSWLYGRRRERRSTRLRTIPPAAPASA